MVNSKKRSKATSSKTSETTQQTEPVNNKPLQAVNETCNLFAIINATEDNNQSLSIYSIHDHQLLVHTPLSQNNKVAHVQWVTSLNPNATHQTNNTTSYSSVLTVPHTQLLIFGLENGDIEFFDLKSKETSFTLSGEHKGAIVDIIQDKDQLFSIAKDHTISHWNLQDGKCLKNWSDNKQNINQIFYLSQAKQLLTAGTSIKLWNLESYEAVKTFNGLNDSVDYLTFFTKDKRIFITYSKSSDNLLFFDTESEHTEPLFKIKSPAKLDRVLAIKDPLGMQVLALTSEGTLIGYNNVVPSNIFHKAPEDLSKESDIKPNFKLQFNKLTSTEILPIKYLCVNTLYNVPLVSRGYHNRLGGFEWLWINYGANSQHITTSRGKSDHLSIDKLSAKRKAAQIEANSTTVDSLDPVQSYTTFPHSLAIEMIQYLNSGKLPTKTLVNLISQAVKYDQKELISLHLTNIGIHQLIKILPHMAPEHIPALFNTLMELLSASRTLSARALSWLRGILVYHRNSLMSNGMVVDRLTEVLEKTTGSQLDNFTGLTRLEGRLRHIQQQIKLREHIRTPELRHDAAEEESIPEDMLSSKESAFEQGYSAFEDSDDDGADDEPEESFFGIPEEDEGHRLDDKLAKVNGTGHPSKKQKK